VSDEVNDTSQIKAFIGGNVAITNTNLELDLDLQTTDGTTIWDSSEGHIPQGRLENDSITINGGDGLKDGSTAALGGSFSLDVEPGDFAGQFLSDDGTDNLQVNLGNGLEGDGADSIRVNGGGIAGNGLVEGNSSEEVAIDVDGVGTDELDTSQSYSFTSTQTITGDGTRLLNLEDESTGDFLSFESRADDTLVLSVRDTSAPATQDLLSVDPSTQQVDVEATLSFPNIQGTPTFASHDHSEGGMTTIPNSGLDNSNVTVSTGDGLTGGGQVSLGDSITLDLALSVEDDATDVIQASGLNFGTALSVTDDGDGTVTISGEGGTDIEDGGTSVTTNTGAINFGTALSVTDDGDGTVTVDGEGGADIEEDGTTVVSSTGAINFTSNLDVTDDGDGTVTVAAESSTDTRTDVSDAGTQVVANVSDINFGSNISVTDDNDGTVTVSAQGGTDTRTDVSDGGTQVEESVSDINFGSNVSVTDDGDGTVTVSSTDTNTDTRTDISDSGSNVVSDTSDINFGTDISVTDDGDGSVTVDAQTTTDTRTDVSDNGSLTISDAEDINFSSNLDVTDDGDGTVTVDGAPAANISDNGTQVVGGATDVNFADDIAVTDDGDSTVTVNFSRSIGGNLDLNTNKIQNAGRETTTISSNLTTSGQETVFADVSGGSLTVTLSTADTFEGSKVRIVDNTGSAGTNNITINTEAGQTINGESSAVIDGNFEALTLESDGSNWFVVSRMEGGVVQ